MKYVLIFPILFLFALSQVSHSQDERPIVVSLLELKANPKNFHGRVITVRGFLEMQDVDRQLISVVLHLHEEDAKYALDNGVLVIATEQMLKERERLDMHYVSLTGKVTVTPVQNGGNIVSIRDIQYCVPWPDPSRSSPPRTGRPLTKEN